MREILGVIGGSGIYDIPGLERLGEERVETPWGPPSDAIARGRIGDQELLFLPRHGRGHRIAPHEIDARANVCALKKLGATAIVSLSAVGSMKEAIHPGDVVVVDQYIDLTKRRPSTFFEGGVVAHVSFAEPTCQLLSSALAAAARRAGATVHQGGTYVCMEGPQFSTRAESLLYRSWGVDVIGMTAMPEAKLAREAELPYATLALATDYDCWHEEEQPVTVEAVLAIVHANAERARATVRELAGAVPDLSASPARSALASAVMTAADARAPAALARLDWLLARRDA
ncbi:MAG: S-methyl-5'-thioadenosine phosphorylase [Polyangiaceae bacterium]|nr:S-methyl-5'-thioadenosine phosphorylase [Polyangiaceae bacterium]